MIASYSYTPLTFKRPAGTSRGVLTQKHSWIIRIENTGKVGIGECSIIPELSPDFTCLERYEATLNEVVLKINSGEVTQENCAAILKDKPSILFGVECAFRNMTMDDASIYFDNSFSRGEKKLPINGLIWMGDASYMEAQIAQKLAAGFSTIKMKIGAIDIHTELSLLAGIRTKFSKDLISLRVDANGAFTKDTAPPVLEELAKLDIHSIEQPIKAGQWEAMRTLCATSPTPIALDEELIGISETSEKIKLLDSIQPQFIILKPSLHGGISGCREWISLAEQRNIPWWMTSALESNIGLKAICDFTAEFDNDLPQGLGTGSLYERNFPSKLTVSEGHIFWDNSLTL